MQRGDEFSIRVGTIELMNNRLRGSEQALATLTCARLRDRARARVLIGGLGMGFTLRAALDELGPQASVVVAEIVPAVVVWARGPLSKLFARLQIKQDRSPLPPGMPIMQLVLKV